MTLNDYANAREDVVIFWAGFACPTGDYTVAGYPDLDFAERNGLLDLEGEIDAAGDWRWNGEGNPTDDRNNTITKVHAYVDVSRYESIIEEYEAAV